MNLRLFWIEEVSFMIMSILNINLMDKTKSTQFQSNQFGFVEKFFKNKLNQFDQLNLISLDLFFLSNLNQTNPFTPQSTFTIPKDVFGMLC